MTGLSAFRDRARRIAVAVVVLVLLGTATAAAYWVATAQVTSTTQAASTGLAQELRPAGQNDSLAGPYTAQAPSRAGIVALTNTGSRDATATLTLAADGGALADPALHEAVRVSVGRMTSDQGCTPQVVPQGSVAGTLASDLTFEGGTVGAGATVLVCVRTSLAADGLTTHAGKQIDLALTTSLRYAAGEQWTVRAQAPLTAVQTIEKDRWSGLPEATYEQNGANLYLHWTRGSGSTHYRLSLASPAAPGERSPLRDSQQLTASPIHLHHSNDQAALRAYLDAGQGRLGDALIFIEESAGSNGSWTPVAVAEVRLVEQGNDIRIRQR